MTINGVKVVGDFPRCKFGFYTPVCFFYKKGNLIMYKFMGHKLNFTKSQLQQLKELENAPQKEWDPTKPCKLIGPPFM